MVDLHAPVFQSFRLGQGAGHPVQDKAPGAVGAGHPFRDDPKNEIVGNQVALVHVFLCFFAQGSTIGNGLPEHIPGRNGGDGELFNKQLRLCPLSSAGRAQ